MPFARSVTPADIREVQSMRKEARDFPNQWEVSNDPVTEPQLINRLVRRRSKVACIGAFNSLEEDPSAWWLAKGGSVART